MQVIGEFNYYIVILSIIVSIIASYSALTIFSKASFSHNHIKYFWLIIGAVVMASGIWAMHFIGMVSYDMSMGMPYDMWMIMVAMMACLLFILLAFYMVMPIHISHVRIWIGILLFTAAIQFMHFIGMRAMDIPLTMTFNVGGVILALIISLMFATSGVYTLRAYRRHITRKWLKLLASCLLAFSISGMHYMTMLSTNIYINLPVSSIKTVDTPYMVYASIGAVAFMLIFSGGAILIHRYILEQMAFSDVLTGLQNRLGLQQFLETCSEDHTVGILFIDLDQFKMINDTFGHNIGDKLIQETARRLYSFANPEQQVFRIGGDEFLYVVKDCKQADLERLARHIIEDIQKRYVLEENEIFMTLSIGISIGNGSRLNVQHLQHRADIAMYKAKTLGKNRYHVYRENLGMDDNRYLVLESDIKQALERKEFYLVYQPKWDLEKNRPYAFEVLLRWHHPKYGVIFPDEFIPLAKKHDMIVPITSWMSAKACYQAKDWQINDNKYKIALNVPTELFHLSNFKKWLTDSFQKIDFPLSLLELEISEEELIFESEYVINQLEETRKMGVEITLDHFGRTYSSIGLLNQVPFTNLKLDQSFLKDIVHPTKHTIVRSTISLAKGLALEVVADEVENAAFVEVLKEMGCYKMQGFYFTKPLHGDDVSKWIGQFNG